MVAKDRSLTDRVDHDARVARERGDFHRHRVRIDRIARPALVAAALCRVAGRLALALAARRYCLLSLHACLLAIVCVLACLLACLLAVLFCDLLCCAVISCAVLCCAVLCCVFLCLLAALVCLLTCLLDDMTVLERRMHLFKCSNCLGS